VLQGEYRGVKTKTQWMGWKRDERGVIQLRVDGKLILELQFVRRVGRSGSHFHGYKRKKVGLVPDCKFWSWRKSVSAPAGSGQLTKQYYITPQHYEW